MSALPDIADRAEETGLLDVAYVREDSPVGELLLAATPRGLARVAYVDGDEDAILGEIAARISPRVLRAPRRLDLVRRELDEYFAGRRREFDIGLDLSAVHGFGRRVLDAATALPYGATATYTQIAAQAGSPRGARAAGNALGRNPIPIIVPCHRVLHAAGGLGGYTGGVHRKRLLLDLERGERGLFASE